VAAACGTCVQTYLRRASVPPAQIKAIEQAVTRRGEWSRGMAFILEMAA
jgi:hypothetical protein